MQVRMMDADRPASGRLIVGTNDEPPQKLKGQPEADPPAVGGQAPLILVVDDDVANLQLAEALLEAEGFRVRLATDAYSTFEVLKICDPAVILMDIQLPGMDGWTLTRRLKTIEAVRHIPIIALTAYGRAGDDARAREAGFVEFVAKPVSTWELPTIVRKYLPATHH